MTYFMGIWYCDHRNKSRTGVEWKQWRRKNRMYGNSDYTILHLRGRGGADEFDAILQSSFFWIPFAPFSSMQSEYFPTMPPNKSLSCMVLMRFHSKTQKMYNLTQLLFPSGVILGEGQFDYIVRLLCFLTHKFWSIVMRTHMHKYSHCSWST